MIDRFAIKNYRCFKSVDVPVGRINFLIGPNDSGKSAFLSAVERIATAASPFPASDHFNRNASNPIELRAWIGNSEIAYGSKVSTDPSQLRAKSMLPIAVFRPPSTGLLLECQIQNDSTDSWNPGENGSNLASVLDGMLRRHRKSFDAVVATMQKMVPGLRDILIGVPNQSTRRIDFQFDGDLIVSSEASAGLKLLVFFVTIALHPTKPNTMLVEEPENGLHPRRLADVVDLLRGIADGRFGNRPSQVFVTTHSPYLLDCVNLETDKVLVFERQGDGSRTVTPVDQEGLSVFLDEFALGEIWVNRNESGLVKK